jgi:hypothetical protein
LPEFKASDCRHLGGVFEGWDRREANTFAIRCVNTVADASAFPFVYGFGAAMVIPRTEREEDRTVIEDVGFTYCFSTILVNVLAMIRFTAPEVTAVQFIHDEQPGMQGRLQEAFGHARKWIEPDCHFHLSHLQFEDSRLVLPLQAADILAYETRKDIVNRLEKPQRARSRALIRLMENRPHVGFYVDVSVLDAVQQHHVLPPLLYKTGGIQAWMPWIEH